jgi:UDP-N-acetylglucosamine--N-acetylmuramyl-(pentapeptide) pyrophosphoryl-undecaprenol N-acetylglucosamine transferase
VRVVIAGGGTGGHLYPGIAVARELARRVPDVRISFAGTSRGLESRVVPLEGFALDTIRSAGLKGKSMIGLLRGAWLLPVSLLDAWRVVSARRPDVVIGVGGYSSGPIVLVASVRGVPALLLEQNAVPGLTNRLLSPWARAVAVSFDRTRRFFGEKAFVSGNPVRPEFLDDADRAGPAAAPGTIPRVLVFGGSQGAHAINLAMAEGAADLAAAGNLRLTHQTGPSDFEMVRTAYAGARVAAEVAPYFDDMGRRMRQADVVVCRAGATTLAEIAAAGKPSILVPLPTATDDHQRANAEAFAAAGAAEVLLQSAAAGGALVRRVVALARDAGARTRMADAARRLARPSAARIIVDRVLELAKK